jgi:leucine dehydrogenase
MKNGSLEIFQKEFEQVVYGSDPYSGLKAIIAIHNTALGPGLGGVRMMTYEQEQDALLDALSLAKAMSYKNAAAGLKYGGAKAVIIGDPQKDKTEHLLRAFGRLIESLGGRYIPGVDIGTVEDDMVIVSQETQYCASLPEAYGGCGSTSEATAYGLYYGIQAAVEATFENPALKGKTIAIQGVGHVGSVLAKYLLEAGAKVVVSDICQKALERIAGELPVDVVANDAIYDQDVDIFSPCALGGVLNDETIPRLKCKLIAGAANNQLADEEKHCTMIEEKGISYGVDFILNAGGVIANTHQFHGYKREIAYADLRRIGGTIKNVFKIAEEERVDSLTAAKMLAEQRMKMAVHMKSWYLKK